jgi:DNA-directed RNA polymerase specialized sigma24 family protein
MAQTVDRQLVLSAWQTLSIDHRRVLLECYFRGASVAGAAETLGVPAATVKARIYYALRTLRDAIDAIGGIAKDHGQKRSAGPPGERFELPCNRTSIPS